MFAAYSGKRHWYCQEMLWPFGSEGVGHWWFE